MFNTEEELVIEFKVRFISSFLGEIQRSTTKRYVILQEFDSFNGVADLVLAVFSPSVRLRKKRSVINTNWLLPLTMLPVNTSITKNEYISRFGISDSTAQKQLDNFEKASYIKSMKNGTFRVTKTYSPIVDTAVAIEAKLYDWRRALEQAYRYKRFSNYAFVLMPAENVTSAVQNIEFFKKYNVGLMSIGKNGLEIHSYPMRLNSKCNEAFLRLNETAYTEAIAAA